MGYTEFEIENLRKEIEILRNTEQTAMLGWWIMNFSTKTYSFSDYLRKMVDAPSNEMSFNEFRTILHPNDFDRIVRNGTLFSYTGVYEETFQVMTKYGYRLVYSKLGKKEINNKGEIIARGYMRIMDDTEVGVLSLNHADKQLNQTLDKYSTISSSLISLLNSSNTDQAMEKTLHDILDLFKGDRVYIFEYDKSREFQNCVHEVTSSPNGSMKETLQNLPSSCYPWWTKEICNRIPIILNCLDELPPEASREKEFLESQHINSLIVVPLISKDYAFGYFGIDIVNSNKLWSRLDKQWLISIASMLSMCLELKHALLKAGKEQKRFNELYDNMPMGLVQIKLIYDEQGEPIDYIHLEANNAVEKITGVKRETFIGKRGSEIPGMLSKKRLKFFDGIAKNNVVLSESDAYSIDGHYYAYNAYSRGNGEFVIIFHDSTDKMVIHNDLVKNRIKLNKIFQNVLVGIEIYNKEGILMEINDADIAIFGVVREEVVGKVNLFNNPNLPQQYIDELRKGNNIDIELVYDHNNIKRNNYFGTTHSDIRHLSVKSNMLYDSNNEVESIILVIVDNTETISFSDKIREFEYLFDSMSEFAGIGLGRYNMIKDEFIVTDQWCTNLCKTQDKIGNFAQTYSNICSDDMAFIAHNFRALRDGSIDNFRAEIEVKDGETYKWLKCYYKISKQHRNTNRTELVGLNIDITAQKDTEYSLIEAKTKAEESDRLKSAFLANMSHEIRTPLNAIVGFSDILTETYDMDERKQYMTIIRQNNDLLLQLISDVLDISKIESGTVSITNSDVDVNTVCKEIVRSNSIKTSATVELIFDRYSDLCTIHTDKNKLVQILTNFIGNAIKFTQKGTIKLGYITNEDSISFYVKDSGIGIEKDKIYFIFDRFVKLDTFSQGSGLGLSICRSLANKMQGMVWAESEPGEGSCFWLSLPYNSNDQK